MKLKYFVPFVALSLAIVGCTPTTDPAGESGYKSVSIATQPTKTRYTVGECFEPAGLVINAVTSSDVASTVAYDSNRDKFTFSPSLETPLTLENTSVTVTFAGLNTTIPITVTNAPSGDVSLETFNREYKGAVLSNHNYSAHILSTYDDMPDEDPRIMDYNVFNINDNVMYHDADSNFYNGIIKQKNQGIVNFEMLKVGTAVLPSTFVATNLERGVSEVYSLSIENLFNADFQATTTNGVFSATNRNAVVVGANLAMGDYAMYTTMPENYYYIASVNKESKTVTFEIKYVYNYQDESAGSLDDTFVQAPLTLVITVSNIGSTANDTLSSYVENPTETFEAPRQWSTKDQNTLKTYFGNVVPPFIEGLSYSYRLGQDVSSGYYVGVVEDYACGDLRSSYASILTGLGYTQGVEFPNKYYKYETADGLKHTYEITLNYLGVNETDGSGVKYGYFYSRGVFTVKFLHTQKIEETITNVGLLNAFLSVSKAKDVLPQLPLDDSIRVSGFADGTDTANKQAEEANTYALVAPSSGGLFKIHIPTYREAIQFWDSYGALLVAKGFELSGRMGSFMFNTYMDEHYSKVYFNDTVYEGEASYPGYIQIQFLVYSTSIPAPTTKTLQKINLSGYTTTYKVGDTFTFDGTVTAVYSTGETATVTPTRVSSPDMSSAGTKEVTVYYEENGVTVSAKYNIVVKAEQPTTDITITYYGYDNGKSALVGVDLEASTLPTTAKAGETVNLEVVLESGYVFRQFYPWDDDDGPMWSQAYSGDFDIYSKTASFVAPSTNVEISIVVVDGTNLKLLDHIELTGYTTEYHTYDEFSFDGVCTAYYTNGESAVVTPTKVSSPNMTVPGTPVVRVEYEEDGIEVYDEYKITVTEEQKTDHTITVNNITGITVTVTYPRSLVAVKGDTVRFEVAVSSGYELDKINVVASNGVTVTYAKQTNPMTGKTTYSFTMPDADVSITPVAKGSQSTLQTGKYDAPAIRMSGADTTFSFVFNENGKGYYQRTPKSSTDSSSAKINFTYIVRDNDIVLTYVEEGSDGFSSFATYRPFGAANFYGEKIVTGNLNSDGTVTFELYNDNYEVTVTWTFTKQ